MVDARLVDASFFRDRRVLVTGHTGFKGAWLASWLDQMRAKVSGVASDKCYEVDGSSRGRREDDRLGGHDPYSASKACAELVATSYRLSFLREHKVGLATARAGNVIGGGDFTVGRLVPDCIAAFAA